MKQKRRKRSVTLIEIMIVILLIGLIGGALAFNMRGSMDKGRTFKSEQNRERLYNILMLEAAKGDKTLAEIIKPGKIRAVVESSGLVRNPDKILEDAWGNPFEITLRGNDDLKITSPKLPDHELQ